MSKPKGRDTKPGTSGGGRLILSDCSYFVSHGHTGKEDCPCNECSYIRMEKEWDETKRLAKIGKAVEDKLNHSKVSVFKNQDGMLMLDDRAWNSISPLI